MEFMLPNWQEFHFLRPLWLLALIPVVLFLAALWRINSSVSAWDRAIDKSLLPFLLDRSRNAAQGTPLALLAGAWILSVIALAGPVWEKLPQPVQQREDALVIVQDLSLSMFAPDHVPNRLDLAKRKLRDILDQRDEGQTALVVYAGDAHAVTPLTDDAVTIAALVPSLSPNIMPLFGSNPGAALDVAISLLNDIEASRGRILLITDGIAGFAEEQMLAEKMAETDYELLIMGVGTEEGAPIRTSDGGFLTDVNGETVIPTLNRNVLESLANRTGGRYHDIQLSNADINYLLADSPFFDETLSEVEEEFDIWYEAGPWLMLLIVPFAALSFRRGWLFGLALLFTLTGTLTPTRQAQAWEWRDLWQTSDQQGAKAMEAENFEDAAGLFENRNWQGAAMYRSENYESAIAAFSSDISADGHYNRGNALALTGNYEQAIAAYDEALELQPDHADALHNKEIVEQLLQEQESQEGESEGENSEQQQQEGSEQEQENQDNSDQQQQESQEGNQDQEQQQQQQQQPEEQEGSESNSEQNTPSEETNEQFEEQQSLEQWLRRIEDDPGELLQRKFRYEYRQRQLNGTANNLQSGEQIW
ncbi:MAG: VWA domain-containing protein [Gammaproteobacteria bacterium]|nr:VWA domain-containing protein [Pseudomonadales bacterium]MCP5346073.1 VWA domain-containing protein [Pseudomonadales bacterium]